MFEKGSLAELFSVPVSDGVAHREEPPVDHQWSFCVVL